MLKIRFSTPHSHFQLLTLTAAMKSPGSESRAICYNFPLVPFQTAVLVYACRSHYPLLARADRLRRF